MFDTIESMYETSKDAGGSAVSQSPPSKMVFGSARVVDVVVLAAIVLVSVVAMVVATSFVVGGADGDTCSSDEVHDTATHATARTAAFRNDPLITCSD
jgi:hypothetical protein